MRNVLSVILITILMSMCTNNNNSVDTELKTKNDSLERLINTKDSAIYLVIETFNEIENNLNAIKAKEKIITSTINNIENPQAREQKINEDINLIYGLMLENKNKVAHLQNQLNRANINNRDLQNTIKNLQQKLVEKNAEILELRQNLIDMNITIDELTYTLDTLVFDIQVKNSIIESQTEEINAAFYLFGTPKELKKLDVLDKKGSFIGIGKNINENFNKDYFAKIDKRNKKSFIFSDTKKIKILTTHPSLSYTIYGNKPVDSLVIDNTDEFWSISKYLIISITP